MSGYRVYITTQSAYHEKIFVDMEDSSVVDALKPLVPTPCLLDSVRLKELSVALTDFQRKDRIVDWLKRHMDERIYLIYLHSDESEMLIPMGATTVIHHTAIDSEAIRQEVKRQIEGFGREVAQSGEKLRRLSLHGSI